MTIEGICREVFSLPQKQRAPLETATAKARQTRLPLNLILALDPGKFSEGLALIAITYENHPGLLRYLG